LILAQLENVCFLNADAQYRKSAGRYHTLGRITKKMCRVFVYGYAALRGLNLELKYRVTTSAKYVFFSKSNFIVSWVTGRNTSVHIFVHSVQTK